MFALEIENTNEKEEEIKWFAIVVINKMTHTSHKI